MRVTLNTVKFKPHDWAEPRGVEAQAVHANPVGLVAMATIGGLVKGALNHEVVRKLDISPGAVVKARLDKRWWRRLARRLLERKSPARAVERDRARGREGEQVEHPLKWRAVD